MRLAILIEDGKEIWRGKPAHMPIRFVVHPEDIEETVNWSMVMAVDAGTPIHLGDEDDNMFDEEMVIHPEDLY